ncbi:Bax inhibitor-1/YccA family protein [soil metagenome]
MENYSKYNDSLAVKMNVSVSKFMLNVYNWMAIGLGLTGLIAYVVSISPDLLQIFVYNRVVFFVLMLAQLGIVIGMSSLINRIPSFVAMMLFFLYAAMNGLTFAVLFVIYTKASIFYTFFICAGMFATFSVAGTLLKLDLTKFRSFFLMGLIGIIIASVVNIFLSSPALYWIISIAGVVLFTGLTAYDTQKIRKYAQTVDVDSEDGKKGSIFGALNLYLDFINLFLFLLRILGSRR